MNIVRKDPIQPRRALVTSLGELLELILGEVGRRARGNAYRLFSYFHGPPNPKKGGGDRSGGQGPWSINDVHRGQVVESGGDGGQKDRKRFEEEGSSLGLISGEDHYMIIRREGRGRGSSTSRSWSPSSAELTICIIIRLVKIMDHDELAVIRVIRI